MAQLPALLEHPPYRWGSVNPPRDLDPYGDIRPPAVACPDQAGLAIARVDGAAVFCD